MTVMLHEPPFPPDSVNVVDPFDLMPPPDTPAAPAPTLDVLSLVPDLGPDDVGRVNELALLARAGKASKLLHALDVVRVHPAKVQDMLDKATDKSDTGYRVLAAAFAVRGSDMITRGLSPTDDAKRKFRADDEYQRRSAAALRALRTEGHLIEAFRYYAVGRLAIVTANIGPSPATRILGPRTPDE